jgi:hypothetical protein
MATTNAAESFEPLPRETVSRWLPSGYVGESGASTIWYAVALSTTSGCRSSVTCGWAVFGA